MTDDAKLFIGTIPLDEIEQGLNLLSLAGKEIILMRRDDTSIAFENRCPHRNKMLYSSESLPTFDPHHLECEHHGAVFELPHGECVSGPCPAEKLTPITVTRKDSELTLFLNE